MPTPKKRVPSSEKITNKVGAELDSDSVDYFSDENDQSSVEKDSQDLDDPYSNDPNDMLESVEKNNISDETYNEDTYADENSMENQDYIETDPYEEELNNNSDNPSIDPY